MVAKGADWNDVHSMRSLANSRPLPTQSWLGVSSGSKPLDGEDTLTGDVIDANQAARHASAKTTSRIEAGAHQQLADPTSLRSWADGQQVDLPAWLAIRRLSQEAVDESDDLAIQFRHLRRTPAFANQAPDVRLIQRFVRPDLQRNPGNAGCVRWQSRSNERGSYGDTSEIRQRQTPHPARRACGDRVRCRV